MYHIFYQSFDVTCKHPLPLINPSSAPLFFYTYADLDLGLSHDLWIWTYVETNLLVICSAIPPLRVLFKRLVGNSSSHNASKILEHTPFHGRRPSNNINMTNISKNGGSTDAIALHGMEPGTSQSPGYQAKPSRQVDSGHKVQNSRRITKVYLDKELPPIK